MKIFNLIEWILFLLSIILFFFYWKIALILFLITSLVHIIPMGPNYLLGAITGYLITGGFIYLFINWKIGVALIIGGFLVMEFRIYGNKRNHEYYKNKKEDRGVKTGS